MNSPIAAIRDLTATAFIARVTTQLPQIVAAALALAIAVELAFLVLGFLGGSRIGSPAMPAAVISPGSPRRSIDLQSIVNAHLFGVAAPVQSDASEAPDTTMNLVLAGTIATTDPRRGLAIIGETAANAKVYSVGDAVNGATLYAVYTDRVLLERGGLIEALALPHQALATGAGRAAYAPAAASNGANANTGSQDLAENVRRLIARDPGVVSEVMRPQQVFQNGQMRGFRVYPGRNRQQFSKLGLQPGDLVTAVNGTALDDPQRGNEIFRTIGTSDSVHVTIERNGRSQELTLNMAQVANQAQELDAGNANSSMIPMSQTPPTPADDAD